MSLDRLSEAWRRLLDGFMGRKAAKTIDACALYWGVVVKVAGSKVDVQLDSPDIASPSGVPLYLGFPSSSVTLVGGERVLVGFRNGDPTQPYAIAFEFNATNATISIGQSSPQAAARKGDAVGHGTLAVAFGPGSGAATLAITYTPGDGSSPQSISGVGGTLTIKEAIQSGSSKVSIGG